jgi:glutamate racemase
MPDLRDNPDAATPRPAEIGVFDSGVGGLSVLRELRRQLPEPRMRYVADTAYAPYGPRSPDDIRARSERVASHLIDAGARLVVIACNTATAHAIDALRQRWPQVPFVGTEPGIKPAVAASRLGRVGVLATPATAASERYRALVSRHAGATQVVTQGCAGVVDWIEAGRWDAPELRELWARYCEPLRAAAVDTVLLGCTHYPLVQEQVQAAMGPDVRILNVEAAVAQQAARLWQSLARGPDATGGTSLQATGRLDTLQRLYEQVFPNAQTVTAEPLVLP